MLFAHLFSYIPRRKHTAKSKQSKKARRCSSMNSQKRFKKKLSKPISTIINKLLKRKPKLNKSSSQPMLTGNSSSSQINSLSSKAGTEATLKGVEGHDFQHTIIYVTPICDKEATNKHITNVQVNHKVMKRSRPAKITLRRECTSLPSLLPYVHKHPLPSQLRRSLSVTNQRVKCCSALPQVASVSSNLKVELPSSKSEDSISVASSTSLSQTSSISSLNDINQESFSIATRPSSRHGIAYEIVFKAPSVRCSLTPGPQFGPDYTYSFPRALAEANEEEDEDDWNSDDEFEDSDELEGEEEEETAPPAPRYEYGMFFTAAKPPLPPSALARIKRYTNYKHY